MSDDDHGISTTTAVIIIVCALSAWAMTAFL